MAKQKRNVIIVTYQNGKMKCSDRDECKHQQFCAKNRLSQEIQNENNIAVSGCQFLCEHFTFANE